MKKRFVFLAVIAVLVLAAVALPWKAFLETQLKKQLEARGFQNVQLTVSHLGLNGLVLKDVSIGAENPLHLNQLTLGFSLPALLTGNMSDIAIAGLSLDMSKQNESWVISGLTPSRDGDKTSLPVTDEALAAIPFDSVELENSQLHIATPQWQVNMPLDLSWHKTPVPELLYEASGLNLKARDITATTGSIKLKAVLDKTARKWTGEWQINDVNLTGFGPEVPVLNGKGTVTGEESKLMVQGQFASADQSYKAGFNLNYFLHEPEKSLLEIIETSMPWKGGILSTANVKVPLQEKRTIHFNLQVQHASLDALLEQLTRKETTATGAISGSLPITVEANGNFSVQAGKLQADESGVIAMPADSIPGDNPQVALARDVLKNLHYKLLSIDVDQDKDNKLSVLMKIEGNNPDVYEGKPVKLNVQLTGDVLNFIQQNMMILTNPEKLLQQGQDEKH